MGRYTEEADKYIENKGILFTKSDVKEAYINAAKSTAHMAKLALCATCIDNHKHYCHECITGEYKCQLYNTFVEYLEK